MSLVQCTNVLYIQITDNIICNFKYSNKLNINYRVYMTIVAEDFRKAILYTILRRLYFKHNSAKLVGNVRTDI